MPSPWHDTISNLVEERPGFIIEVARDWLDIDTTPGLPGRLGPTVFNTRPSKDLIADMVVLAGPAYDVAHVVVVEAQQEPSPEKLRKLPKYAMAAHLQYDCPADVLMICPDKKTADWYGQAIPTNVDSALFYPRVLFPQQVPKITDPGEVAAEPERAVLSVAYHGDDPAVANAFVSGVGTLGGKRAPQYYEYGFSMSSAGVRDILRRIMSTTHWPVYSPFAKEHFGKGQVEDRRDSILEVLEERGLEVTAPQRKRINDCADLDQLKKWHKAAVTAASTDDLFR